MSDKQVNERIKPAKGVMNEYVKKPLSIIGIRAAFMLVSVFVLLMFQGLLGVPNGILYITALNLLLLIPSIYVDGWHLAYKESRASLAGRQLYRYPADHWKGFRIAAFGVIPSVVLLVMLYVAHATDFWFIWVNLANIIYALPYIGILGLPSTDVIGMDYVAVGFVFPILIDALAYGIGYFLGFHDKNIFTKLMQKLVYKKKS